MRHAMGPGAAKRPNACIVQVFLPNRASRGDARRLDRDLARYPLCAGHEG